MKKVATKLRLDLAAYNELLDFARLGTELDSAAQAQIDRGSRMVELLKQPQFSPVTVGEQVITIFAGSSGLLDDIPVKAINKFACSFLQWLSKEHGEYLREIDQTLKLTDELADKLTDAIKTFKTLSK